MIKGSSLETLYSRLTICYGTADYSKTIELADKILRIDKNHVDAILFKGRALLARGNKNDYANAAKCLKSFPKDPFACCHAVLADLFINNSDHSFRSALRKKITRCIDATKKFKNIKYQDQEVGDKEKDLKFCYDLAKLGDDLYKKNDKELMQRIEHCDKEKEELSSEQQELFFWQGIYFKTVKELDKALRCFEVILNKKSMPCSHSLTQRGIIFLSQKKIEKAFEEFNKVNPPNPQVNQCLAQIWLERARLCRLQSEFSRELNFLQKARTLAPDDLKIQNKLERAAINVAELTGIRQEKQESKGSAEDLAFSVAVTPPAPGVSEELSPLVLDATKLSPGGWQRAPSSLRHIPPPAGLTKAAIPAPEDEKAAPILPGQPDIPSPTVVQGSSPTLSARSGNSLSNFNLGESAEEADKKDTEKKENAVTQELSLAAPYQISSSCRCVIL